MNYCLILAGGTGTRFWPFSRELEPKQFMQIIGKRSFLQDTVKRVKDVIPVENIYVITNLKYLYEVKEQLGLFGIKESNIILEPSGKSTAPAIGLCARFLLKKDKDALLIVLPSDHYIRSVSGFRHSLRQAIACAKEGNLVTLGIRPTAPSTGYGYIKVRAERGVSCLKVEKFLEKPDEEEAEGYFKNKNFYWNSGMFIWKAEVFLREVERYLPGLYGSLMRINNDADLEKIWPGIEPVSVDYGIMERSKRIVLIPAKFDWTDLGSWDALVELMPKDKSGNIVSADSIDLSSRGMSIFSRSNRLISTIGLKDLIIVDTPDALLVCDKNKAQDVKKIVHFLKSRKRKECVTHTTEKRPWGNFTVLQTGEGFKIKLIEIYPKKRLSLQSHKMRAEHWVVVSGTAKVTTGRTTKRVKSNHSIYVPIGAVHRLENPYNMPLRIVEVQTGAYLEEDDINRFSDDFRR